MTLPDAQPHPFFSGRSRIFLWLIATLLFAVGLVIRLYDLSDLPLDFHATRQLHSILMARGMYYQNLETAPQWQRDLAVRQWKAEGLIEPPVMERLTALTYRLVGAEDLRIPRLYSIFFWMLGSVFLFLLALDLVGAVGALVALAYYVILPYAAVASRAFQPDPLLVASIVTAWWAMLRWYRRPTWSRAVAAGLLAGWAIFVKSVAVFFIGPAWLGLLLAGLGFRRTIRTPQVYVMALLTVLPYAGFHIYGVYITGLLESQFSLRFFPQLWPDPVFYLRWNGMITRVTGFEFFLAAVLGLFTVRDRAGRAMLLAVLAGYFLYGMALPYHISTHDYYQEPLVPLVALGLAAGMDVLTRALRGPRWLVLAAFLAVLAFAVTIKAWDVRVTLKRDDYRGEAVYWQKLGQTIGQDSAVIGLLHDYGYRLAYWGWISSTNWMTTGDINLRELAGQSFDIQQVFEEQTRGKDYFVVTLMDEFDSQGELKKLLTQNYAVYKQSDDYIIFDLHQPAKKP